MIKFLDLNLLNDRYKNEFKNEFDNFLKSGTCILGDQVTSFESEFGRYCGTKFCVGVSSGLDALQLIFLGYKALGILNNGDEIIVPANTYIATVLAISNTGLKPVLIEPDIETFNINSKEILKVITPKTKAILGVHLYGQLYNVEALEEISKKHNLLLIEDAAQAHGAVNLDGRKAGNVSHVAAFSFYPTKNLGALGDAGAITTNNQELATILFKLRNYGRKTSYENDIKGFNCRLDELQAAFLRIKLKHLDSENKMRKNLANIYFQNISANNIVLPKCIDFNQHVFHLFVIRSKKRDELKKYLHKNGVETLVHYPVAIHKQLAYKEFKDCELPITEQVQNEVLSLPLNSGLTKNQIFYIVSLINKF